MADQNFLTRKGLTLANNVLSANAQNGRVAINSASANVSLDIQASDAVRIPTGNTSQRPTGGAGLFRYNSESGLLEFHTGSGWSNPGGNTAGGNTEILFNDSGAQGANSLFTFNKGNTHLAVGNASVNGTAVSLGSATINTTTISVGSNNVLNTSAQRVGNATIFVVVNSSAVQIGSGATLNATTYTGTSNNATNLNGQSSGYYLDAGNATGTLNAARLGTTQNFNASIYSASSYIYSSGPIYAAGDITAYYSDERLKSIESFGFHDPLKRLMDIKTFFYRQNNEVVVKLGGQPDHRRRFGVSAQDVREVSPELVKRAAIDFDHDDPSRSRTGKNYLSLDSDGMIAFLVSCVQELTLQVEELRSKVK